VLGIVMMAFGGLGLLSAPMTLASRELGNQTGSGSVQDLIWEGPLATWMSFALFFGTLIALLLLVSGFGVFKRKPWARKSAIGYGITTLVFGALGQLMNVVFLYPKLLELMDSSNTVEKSAAMGGMIGGVIGGLFGMILPIVVLVAMGRPTVKAELS
jgi:hypothetical protein